MRALLHASAPFVVIAFLLSLTPEARANYEYDCGPHRNAMCHQEPRGDESCAQSYGCYGRCGPGCDWSVLGNAYTAACQNHDACVRNRLCSGQSGFNAHAGCVGSLPAAVGSFVQVHWNYGFQWAADTWSGFWAKVKACCN